MFHGTKPRFRRGLTLVELLTVIGVIVILLAVAIPAMRINLADRHIREASRAVNAYLVAQQSRAAEKNRAVGVWIERRKDSPGESIRLYSAEVPPPYAGDSVGAKAVVTADPTNPLNLFDVQFDPQSSLLPAIVAPGDIIRFDYKGPYFQIVNVDSTGPALSIARPRGEVPPVISGTPVPYQILRQPVKSGVSNLELPRTSTIDLNLSGFGTIDGVNRCAPSSANDVSPVIIVFSPSGRVDHVRVQNTVVVPQETVHLLIGRDDLIDTAVPATGLANLDELTNLWVSVGVETGSTSTAEIAKSVATNSLPQRLTTARKFANKKQTMGGG